MTFLTKSQETSSSDYVAKSQWNNNPQITEDLTIHVKTSIEQPSAMSESKKKEVKVDSEEIVKVLNETLIQKGEDPISTDNWVGPNEVEVTNLSSMALHSFVLKAEQLGKKITYEKTLSVRISD